mgnify:CR=1 FL=1
MATRVIENDLPMTAKGSITDSADPGHIQRGSAQTAGVTTDRQISLVKEYYRNATKKDLVEAMRAAEKNPALRQEILAELRKLLSQRTGM